MTAQPNHTLCCKAILVSLLDPLLCPKAQLCDTVLSAHNYCLCSSLSWYTEASWGFQYDYVSIGTLCRQSILVAIIMHFLIAAMHRLQCQLWQVSIHLQIRCLSGSCIRQLLMETPPIFQTQKETYRWDSYHIPFGPGGHAYFTERNTWKHRTAIKSSLQCLVSCGNVNNVRVKLLPMILYLQNSFQQQEYHPQRWAC